MTEIRGLERAAEMRDAMSSGRVGSSMMALAIDILFGSIWTGLDLDRKQRSLVTLGILIALRRIEEFKNHVRIRRRNGLTVAEIEEALMQANAYAGIPTKYAPNDATLDVQQDPSVAPTPRTGGQSQYNALLTARTQTGSKTFQPLERWIAEHLKENLSVEALAERVHMSPRNFARVYVKKRGCTPAKAVEAIRVEAARQRLKETDDRIESVAEQSGFSSEEQMRCAFIRTLGIPPREYRKRFATTVVRTT